MAFNPGSLNWAALAALGSGNTVGEQIGNANAVMAQQQEVARGIQAENQTKAWLAKQFPGEDFSSLSGPALNAAFSQGLQRYAQAKQPKTPELQFQVLPDGTFGNWDKNTGQFNTLGKYEKPVDPTAIQRDLQAAGLRPGTPEYQKAILENYRKNGGQDDYANREAQALKLGMKPDDPRYQSFILTGKMPREDAQTLTAVDKKAILEADDMVAVNEAAIDALKQAKDLSSQANAGWLSGTRATIGNNLPDWAVPDLVSSPESSEATQNFDNAVVGQALTQLKAIFGGAPTEGERKILLDLQGSSNLQPGVREKILDRAIVMAEKRLEFNRERAESLRGNTYYKPKDQSGKNSADAVRLGPNGEGYDQVPPGGQYIAPDGTMRVKGGQ